jgi:hypothetical protein
MVRIKPSQTYDGREDRGENAGYTGPEPRPGVYRGCIKKMWHTTFKGGERQGKPKLLVLFEIAEGPCKSKGLWWHLLGYADPLSAGVMNSRFLPAHAPHRAFWAPAHRDQGHRHQRGRRRGQTRAQLTVRMHN